MGKTISVLDALTTPDRAADLLGIVDDSETDLTKKTKKITVSDLLGDLDDITATAAEINTTCDGSTAKNSHTHTDIPGYTLRCIQIGIYNTNGTITISSVAGFNQSAFPLETIVAGTPGNNFYLHADGQVFEVIGDTGSVPDNQTGILCFSIGTILLSDGIGGNLDKWILPEVYAVGNNITFHFVDNTNNRIDFTSLLAGTNYVQVLIVFVSV